MAVEIEAKVQVASHDPVRSRLVALGAVCTGKVKEYNRLFDHPNGRLRRSGRGLRVRQYEVMEGPERAATMTYKGPRQDERLKVRPEIELEVSDAAAAVSLLQGLGYRVEMSFEKRRETWRLDDCMIELDELPRLGHFVEIEGPSAEGVEDVRLRVGLGDHPLIDETYMGLLRTFYRKAGLDDRHITFAAAATGC